MIVHAAAGGGRSANDIGARRITKHPDFISPVDEIGPFPWYRRNLAPGVRRGRVLRVTVTVCDVGPVAGADLVEEIILASYRLLADGVPEPRLFLL